MALWRRRSKEEEPPPLEQAPPFPEFAYHPDPTKTGSIAAAPLPCSLCGHAYGFVYTGPVFAADDFVDGPLCPWCIADGSAALRLQIEFTDVGDDVPTTSQAACSTRSPSARLASTVGSRNIGSTTARTAPRSSGRPRRRATRRTASAAGIAASDWPTPTLRRQRRVAWRTVRYYDPAQRQTGSSRTH